jgi:hypothetical protein
VRTAPLHRFVGQIAASRTSPGSDQRAFSSPCQTPDGSTSRASADHVFLLPVFLSVGIRNHEWAKHRKSQQTGLNFFHFGKPPSSAEETDRDLVSIAVLESANAGLPGKNSMRQGMERPRLISGIKKLPVFRMLGRT